MPRAVVTAAVFVVVLAGCSEEVPGIATVGAAPAAPTSDVPAGPSTVPSTAPSQDGTGLAGLQPCDLVGHAGLAALALTGDREKTIGEVRVCRYRHEGPTLNESFTVSVELFDTRGLDEIVAQEIHRIPRIGGHDAVTYTGASGGCAVSLGVTETSRVDNAAVGGDHEQACRFATQLAELVEPNLP